MKKVIIIRTPLVYPKKHVTSITAVPDIGTAYISAAIKSAGYHCSIIDAPGEGIETYTQLGSNLIINGITADQIIKKIPHDIDYIGVQSMHSNRWIYDSVIIKAIHENFPKAKIFLGGEHVTATYHDILTIFPFIDACVLGEGEESVVELLNSFDSTMELKEILGIAFINDGNIISNNRRTRNSLLDDLSVPLWDGVPLKSYINRRCGVNSLAKKSIVMLATRGCPFSCTFCTCSNMWDSRWFSRTPKLIIDEMEYYKSNYGIEHIDFIDLTFVINKKWVHNFCDLLIERDLNLTWALPIGTRVESIDSSLLLKMKQAGLTRVLYSAESGSNSTLKKVRKELELSHFINIVKETKKVKICIKIALIFGFPSQNWKDVWETFKLMINLCFIGIDDIVCLSFVPYPGTELFDELKVQYNYNSYDNNIRLNNDVGNMKSWSEHISSRSLKIIVYFTMSSFYILQFIIRPHRFIYLIKRVFVEKKPLTNLESMIANFIKRKTIKN